jgi:hypothetical protein
MAWIFSQVLYFNLIHPEPVFAPVTLIFKPFHQALSHVVFAHVR